MEISRFIVHLPYLTETPFYRFYESFPSALIESGFQSIVRKMFASSGPALLLSSIIACTGSLDLVKVIANMHRMNPVNKPRTDKNWKINPCCLFIRIVLAPIKVTWSFCKTFCTWASIIPSHFDKPILTDFNKPPRIPWQNPKFQLFPKFLSNYNFFVIFGDSQMIQMVINSWFPRNISWKNKTWTL